MYPTTTKVSMAFISRHHRVSSWSIPMHNKFKWAWSWSKHKNDQTSVFCILYFLCSVCPSCILCEPCSQGHDPSHNLKRTRTPLSVPERGVTPEPRQVPPRRQRSTGGHHSQFPIPKPDRLPRCLRKALERQKTTVWCISAPHIQDDTHNTFK